MIKCVCVLPGSVWNGRPVDAGPFHDGNGAHFVQVTGRGRRHILRADQFLGAAVVVGRADDRPGRRAAQLEFDFLAARVLADQVVAVDLGGALGVGRRDGGAALLLLRQGGHVDGTALDEAVQFLLTRGGRNLVQLRTRTHTHTPSDCTQFEGESKLHGDNRVKDTPSLAPISPGSKQMSGTIKILCNSSVFISKIL